MHFFWSLISAKIIIFSNMCKKKRVFFKKKLFGSIFLTLIKRD